jgi:hypothetical protein
MGYARLALLRGADLIRLAELGHPVTGPNGVTVRTPLTPAIY